MVVESFSVPAQEPVSFPADPQAVEAGDGSTGVKLGPRENTALIAPATSRFIDAGEVRLPEQGRPGRSGHETGEAFRARAAEDRHTAVERAQAARTVAGHAVDAEDCEMLLSVLGLDALDGFRPMDAPGF